MSKEAAPLVRRSATAEPSCHTPLGENKFWQQTQAILTSILLKRDYDRDHYVEVELEGGHTLTKELESFVLAPDGPQCLLLVGQYGVGKSTLLSHFDEFWVSARREDWAWIYFNGNRYRARIGADKDLLVQGLLAAVTGFQDQYLASRGKTVADFLDELFANDPGLAPTRLLNRSKPVETQRALTEAYLQQSMSIYLDATLSFLCRAFPPGHVLLVVDNIDPLPPEIQVEVVEQTIALSVSTGARGIVSVRRETEAALSYGNARLFGQFIRSEMKAPPLVNVIERRILKALDAPGVLNAKIGTGAFTFSVHECPEFSAVLAKGLSAGGLPRIIDGLSNGSVREGLRMACAVFASPHLDPRRIVAKLSPAVEVRELWHDAIPNYIAVRSLVLRTSPMYNPSNTWTGNIFGTHESRSHVGPFLRLLIARFLRVAPDRRLPIDSLSTEMLSLLRIDDSLLKTELEWMERKNWLEVGLGKVALTHRGLFIAEEFIHNREYLTYIATDVDMHPECERQLKSVPASLPEQMRNLAVLLECLARREVTMLATIAEKGLGPYCNYFGSRGIVPEVAERVSDNLLSLRKEGSVTEAQRVIAELLKSKTLAEIRRILGQWSGSA